MMLWWGPGYVSLYNDACIPLLGAKHPWALGQPAASSWSQIWHVLQPLIDTPASGGPATWNDSIRLEINRNGPLEEAHFAIACSAVPDDTAPNTIGGVLATLNEITDKVIGERRAATLRDISTHARGAGSTAEASVTIAAALVPHDLDIPFALLYLSAPNEDDAHLVASVGLEEAVTEPLKLLNAQCGSGWPIASALSSESLFEIDDLHRKLVRVPTGPWGDAPGRAVLMSIPSGREGRAAGLMIVGLSTRLTFDESYRDFLELLRRRIAISIASVKPGNEEASDSSIAESNRPKSSFVSHISRGLRTPLRVLFGPQDDALEEQRSTSGALADITQRSSARLHEFASTLGNLARRDSALIASESALRKARATLEEESYALAACRI